MEDGIEILDSKIYDLTELDTLLGTKEAFGWDLNAMMVTARGHRDRKKRPGVDFFVKGISAGLTN